MHWERGWLWESSMVTSWTHVGMMSCKLLKQLPLTTELLQPHWSINHFQCVIISTGSLELIYISLEFRLLWAVQLKSCLPLLRIWYFNFLGQRRAADKIKQFCESGLNCVVETDKHNKMRTMYSKLLLLVMSLKKQT